MHVRRNQVSSQAAVSTATPSLLRKVRASAASLFFNRCYPCTERVLLCLKIKASNQARTQDPQQEQEQQQLPSISTSNSISKGQQVTGHSISNRAHGHRTQQGTSHSYPATARSQLRSNSKVTGISSRAAIDNINNSSRTTSTTAAEQHRQHQQQQQNNINNSKDHRNQQHQQQ